MLKLLITFLLLTSTAYADTKITGLTADTSPSTDDLLTTVDDPSGTPANKKATIANVLKSFLFYTDGTNVGVGSTAPSRGLDVTGTGRFSSTLTASNLSGTNTGDAGVVNSGTIGRAAYYSATGTTLDGTANLVFNGNNVGIGTTAARQNLEIIDADGNNSFGVFVSDFSYNAIKVDGAGTVGIGTPNPDNSIALDVQGSTTVHGGDLLLQQTGAGNAFRVKNSSGTQLFAVEGSTFQNNVYLSTNLGIGTSLSPLAGKLIVFNGNTGLGTFYPGATLDVKGTTRLNAFQLTENGASTGYVMQTNSVGVGTWVAASTLATSGGAETNTLTTITTGIADDQLPVGASSNVAAYKTLPNCTDTGGNHLNYDPSTNSFSCGTSGDGAGSGTPGGGLNAVQYNNGSTFTGLETVFSFNATNVGVGTTNATALLGVSSTNSGDLFRVDDNGVGDTTPGFVVDAAGNVGVGTSVAKAPFQVQSTGVPYALTVVNNATGITNVGIGTINTSYRGVLVEKTGGDNSLDFVINNRNAGTSANTRFFFISTGSGNQLTANVASTGQTAIAGAPSGTSAIDYADGGTASPFWINSNSGLTLGQSQVARLTMNSTGNIGIGTISISDQFIYPRGAVSGSVLMTNSVGLGTWIPASGIASGGGSGTVSSGTADRVAIYDSAGTTVASSSVITDDNTNVGISSTAPGTKLDVQGTVRTTGLQLNLNPNASYVLQSNTVGVGTWVPSTTLAVTATAAPGGVSPNIQYNNAGTMGGITNTASDGTNVGIGTVYLGQVLSIKGNVGIGTSIQGAYITQAPVVQQFVIQSNVGIGTWQARNSLIVMNNGGGTGGGNVGIGSTAPGVSLDVNGTYRGSGSGDNYFAGNVGLGTSIPMNTLSVQGNVGIGSVRFGGGVCVGGGDAGNSGGLCVSHNVGIGTLIPTASLQIFTGTANIGIGTYTSGTSLCWKNCNGTTGRCEIGYATGTLTGNIWSACN